MIYHGGQTQDPEHTSWSLNLKGFYQALGGIGTSNVAFMVADGDTSKVETLHVEGLSSAVTNPFRSLAGPGWDNPTYDVSTIANQDDIDITVVQPTSMDCLSRMSAWRRTFR